MSQPLSEKFLEAFAYAAELHKVQFRKHTSIPYITHLMSVASIVLEAGGDEDQAIAGLLHDAVEDQGGEPTRRAIEGHSVWARFNAHPTDVAWYYLSVLRVARQRLANEYAVGRLNRLASELAVAAAEPEATKSWLAAHEGFAQ